MALELSRNAIVLLLGLASSGARTSDIRSSGASSPSITSRPLKNQWRECSLLDWAMSKHSTSVGSRFMRSRNNLV